MSDKYEFKTKPFKHQLEALSKSMTKKNFAYFMEMGCVDAETEFLTNRGWVRFGDFNLNEWKKPLLVAQAIPEDKSEDCIQHWSFEFVEPISYIKKASNDWYELDISPGMITGYNKRGIITSLKLTGEHTLPTYSTANYQFGANLNPVKEIRDTSMQYIYNFQKEKSEERINLIKHIDIPCKFRNFNMGLNSACSHGLRGFASEYYQPNELNNLTEAEIRFMVAVIADGTYPNVTNNKVDFYFMKIRKFERIKKIAKEAGIPIVCEPKRKVGSKTVYVVHAIAPLRYKTFNSDWYTLPQQALEWVANEVFYWDGTVTPKYAQFYSKVKESADFIQYALMACGWKSVINLDLRKALFTVVAYYNQCFKQKVLPDFTTTLEGILGDPITKPGPNMTNMRPYIRVLGSNKIKSEHFAYCFRVPSGYLILRRNGRVFISGNSGKTKVMIDNIAVLHKAGHITGALVLAPKGVYRNWSEKEIPAHLPDDIDREVLVWKAESTDAAKDKLLKQIQNWDGKKLQIFVFNIESLISLKGKKLLSAFIKEHDSNIFALVDESTCIKNHKAKRTKEAIAIGKSCKVRRIATGSPVTNSPLDLYSQCAFLDPALLGCGSYYAFKNTYANIEKMQTRQGLHYERIISYKNLDKLSGLLDKFSFRVTKKECMDLPDKIYITRDVDLTPEQYKLYKEMQDYQFALLKENNTFQEMSAQVVLTKLLRLHQILCGTFTSDEGEITRIPNHRLDTLAEVLDETQGKVIIWATYLDNIHAIEDMLKEKYGAESYVTYYGETKPDDRVKAIELFQDKSSPVRFFLGNVQTAGKGITLTAASTVVYFSNNFSLELRQQSEDRAHRFGQENKVTYIDLVVPGSMDEKIIKSLISKRNIANEILKDDLDDWISLKPV